MTKSFTKTRIPFPIIDCYHFRWVKGVETPIHDHASMGCLMIILNGSLKEKLFNKELKLLETNVYKSRDISYINNEKGYHSIVPQEKSMSLHFYYPKYHISKIYKKNN